MLKLLITCRLLLLVLAAAFLTSCDKDADKDNTPGGNKNCQLVKAKSDSDKSEFIYDGNNRLIRTNKKENNQIVSYQTFEYNGNNQLTKSTEFSMHETTVKQELYTMYEYSSSGLRSKVTSYSEDFGTGNLGADSYVTYEYSTNNQITKSNNFAYGGTDFRLTNYTTFTYDSKGNIIQAASYDISNRLQHQLEIQYDNRTNIIKILPDLFSAKYNFFALPVILSKNNFTNIVIKAPFVNTNNLVNAGWITNTYTINADGFINTVDIDINLPAFIDDEISATLEYNCK